jgi:hypothetical protein
MSDKQWAKIASLLPGKVGDPGRIIACLSMVAFRSYALARAAGALRQVDDGA